MSLIKNKKNTSPGLDGVQYHALRALPEESITVLANVINWILANRKVPGCLKPSEIVYFWKGKGDKRDLTKHRGITLMTVPFKIATGIIASRKGFARAKLPIFNTGQGGGIAGRTVGTKAAIVETAIKFCLRRGVPLSVIWFDLVKGYDLLTKAGIADSVDAIGWGDDYKEFLLSMQSEYEACVRTPYGLTYFFMFLNGVKQGDPLSPDIYVDWMKMLYR